MKYRNAGEVLPQTLIEQIQQYVQGEYIYVPVKKATKSTPTEYKRELRYRDGHIYVNALEGVTKGKLAHIYNLSPSSVRRIIISQRKRHEPMKKAIAELLNEWNIEHGELKQIYDTVWQIGDDCILKIYRNEEQLLRNIQVSASLDKMGIPVGKTIPTAKGEPYVRKNGYLFHVAQRLHGKNTVSLKGNIEICFEMGKIIAALHCAFKKCEALQGLWQSSPEDELNGWIKETFEKTNWKYIEKRCFNETLQGVEKYCDNLPVQPIHRDVHFGNFLFDNGIFTGYIDFDLSQKNIRIFDLCYFVLSILSEKDKFEITTEEWFDLLKLTFAGYCTLNSLSESETKAVPYVMQAIELLFVAWCAGEDNTIGAGNAEKIYHFVKSNEVRISECVKGSGEK